MSTKHVKFRPETAYQVLGAEINLAIQQALPIALQQAGISVDLVKPYLPAVMQTLAPATAHYVTQRLYNQGMSIMGDEASPTVQQIRQNITNASSAVVNQLPQKPQVTQYQPPMQPMPQQPMPPQAQNVVPIRPVQRQAAPVQPQQQVFQNGDNAPEIQM